MNRALHPNRLVALVGAVALLLLPGAARAADATGCSGQAVSYDEQGTPIDAATAPGEGGTADDPLQVLWAGTIEWSGSTDQVLQNGSYTVSVAPTSGGALAEAFFSALTGQILSGTITNESGQTQASGTVVPSDVVGSTTMVTGTYAVEWDATAEAGSCTGSGYIEIIDSPTGTVTWWVALVLIVLGLTGLLLARPTAGVKKG